MRDMVRISDARMSGTAYGTVVLHAVPESAEGGPLAVVRTGDVIKLNVEVPREQRYIVCCGSSRVGWGSCRNDPCTWTSVTRK